jgi:hypothetical protein
MKLQQRDIALHLHSLPVYDQQNNQQKNVPETAVHILLLVQTELYKTYCYFTTYLMLEKH